MQCIKLYFLLQEAIVIILDVGHSVSQDRKNMKSGFLENSIQCVSMILKRKVQYFVTDQCAGFDSLIFLLGQQKRLTGDCIKVNHSYAMENRDIRTEDQETGSYTLEG
jgi:hypothetical protein